MSRPVDQVALLALVDLAVEHLGIGEVLAPAGLQVHCDQVGPKRAYDSQRATSSTVS